MISPSVVSRGLFVGALLCMATLAACGEDDATETTTEASTETETTTEASTETESDDSSTETTVAVELPGEAWDGFAESGDELAVVGVAFDDVLNIRSLPQGDAEIVATVDPTGSVVATGEARLLSASAWYEVTTSNPDGEKVTGWASVRFLAYLGATDDATASYLDSNAAPSAVSLEDLAATVAAGFASEEPESAITQATASSEGDATTLAEVTYDVIGLGDDAVVGYRLHIFANNEAGTFGLKSIERTSLCGRGLSGELCS